MFRFMFRTNDCWGQQGIVVFENIKDTGKKNEMTSNELAKTLTGGMRVLNGEFRFELGAGRRMPRYQILFLVKYKLLKIAKTDLVQEVEQS